MIQHINGPGQGPTEVVLSIFNESQVIFVDGEKWSRMFFESLQASQELLLTIPAESAFLTGLVEFEDMYKILDHISLLFSSQKCQIRDLIF